MFNSPQQMQVTASANAQAAAVFSGDGSTPGKQATTTASPSSPVSTSVNPEHQIRLVQNPDSLEEMAEQGKQILTRFNQIKTMMQTVHQLVDEAESELAKDVDLLIKRVIV